MRDPFQRLMYQLEWELRYENARKVFESLGSGGLYTDAQKQFAFAAIDQLGIRSTVKYLKIPRKTLQRWCRKYNKTVKRCPDWVYRWAEIKRLRREFWRSRGYG